MRNLLYKSYVNLYRISAVFVLYGMLVGIAAYGLLMGFYAMSSSWIAPMIVSPSDKESLDLASRLVVSESTVEDLKLDLKRLKDSLEEMERHKAALARLKPALNAAIAREREHDANASVELAWLGKQKQQDNQKTEAMLDQIAEVERQIDNDLAAGLITKGDAAMAKTQLNQQRNALTDGRISEVALRDSVLQKGTVNTQRLEVLDKRAELESQIAQLDIQTAISQKQIKTETEQVARLESAICAAKETPYYLSTSSGKTVHFAFVPYENKASAVPDAPVYDCYLSFVACRYVGAVKQVFQNEEGAINPIFRTQMRGFFVQLELEDPEAATSKTLMVGHKPFLI
jgi:hypothetical protein